MVFLWSKNSNKNDDNKRIIAPPRKCMKKDWKGELVGMDDEMGMGEVG